MNFTKAYNFLLLTSSLALCIHLSLSYSSRYPSEGIRIGFISDKEEMSTVFEHSVNVANTYLEIPLISTREDVAFGSSYEAYTTVCTMLMNGVGGIFGPSAKNTALHLMDVCEAKEIPFLYSNMDLDAKMSVINLHPKPKDIAKVLHDLIDAFGWKSFTFLYESGQYLSVLNELLLMYPIEGPCISVRRYDLQLNGNYRAVLRRVRVSGDNFIVIVGSTESLPEVLRQAQQVGIITETYKYIIGSLDLQAIDIEEFRYSEANITGIRMFSDDQPEVKKLIEALGYPPDAEERNITCPVTIEMALLYDAVQMYAETTKTLQFRAVSLNCLEDSKWEKGDTFGNYLQLTVAKGITGKIFLDGGIRTDYNLEIVELTSSGFEKVGDWHPENGLVISRNPPPASNQTVDLNDEFSLVNKSITVLLAKSPPHAMLKRSSMNLYGNDRYEGFGCDLIASLAEKLGFNYTFKMHIDGNYGSFDSKTNVSTGMVREIREGRADLGVTDLTITAEREEGVDFTIPFMNLGISILYKKPRKASPKLFSFMDPFAKDVWLWLGVSFFGVSLSLFILGRIAPAEWDSPFPCIEEPTELENQLTLSNSLWFATGALLQQGSEVAPRAPSTRVLASIWWFFTLIIVASYTANLAAFLTIETPTKVINDVNDLAENKGGVKYGAKSSGSTRNFFQISLEDPYPKMNEYMNRHPELLTKTNEEGVQKVLDENYAFLMESTTIEYNAERICNLTQVGELLDEKSYGIAMRKNWQYRDKINQAILELQESGYLMKLKSKWWKEVGTGGCDKDDSKSDAAELNMGNLGGVYFVLLVGSLLAGLCGILDWIFCVFRKSRRYKVSFRAALKEEIKVVIDFSSDTRIVHSSGSIYSKSSSLTVGSNENERIKKDKSEMSEKDQN